MRTKRYIWNVFKITAAGAIVAAIAFQVGVLEWDGEVAESEADILSLQFTERSPTKKLVDALDSLGHTDPHPYSLNGNVIYFSENRIRKEPAQILEEYQRKFVEEGINQKMHTRADLHANVAMLEGEIVPLRVTRDKIVMGGLLPTIDILNEPGSKVKGPEDVPDAIANRMEAEEMFAGYRWIEITKDKIGSSQVIASFSNENFDYAKMHQKGDGDHDVDVEVPPCPGCERLNRFTDLKTNSFGQNIFKGKQSKRQLEQFYMTAMGNRGWELTDTSRTYRDLKKMVDFPYKDAVVLQFTRGEQFLNVLITEGEDGATVHTAKSR